MSKTIINIKSLTINLPSGISHGLPAGLIGALIHGVMSGAASSAEPETGETTGEGTAAAGTETSAPVVDGAAEAAAPTAPHPVVTTDVTVLAFLNSDARFTLRSFDSIAEHFGNTVELHTTLEYLVNSGQVATKRRRADGATLYQALVDAAVAPAGAVTESAQPAETPALTVENVRQFLQSDERYTQRTIDSVAKFFGVTYHDAGVKLCEMEDDGDVRETRRRSDGASLYQVA